MLFRSAAGYAEALATAGIDADAELVAPGGFTEEGGSEAARALLDARPQTSAIFAANDLSALGAINAITATGRRVPYDVSVVGFDDLRLSAFLSPPLTTIHQPAHEIASRATEILIDLTRGREVRKMRYVFEPRLVVRASTSAFR